MSFKIKNNSIKSFPDYSLDPKELGFGQNFAANMFSCTFKNGAWGEGEVAPIKNFNLHPSAMVFHYGQAIFEGIKAYSSPDGRAQLFRPELNAQRFNRSAVRLEMPQIPEDYFLEVIKLCTLTNKEYIPRRPGSLYIRPTMIGTEACLGVRSSTEFLLFVIALSSGSYFKTDVAGPGSVDVLVSEHVARAAHGGTGNVKAGANYAISLKPIREAKDMGCPQVLFLDAIESRYVEELGGMNVFFSDGHKIITPELTDTILPGVTRQSIVELAPQIGIPVERKIDIKEIKDGISIGTITEAMATGTAAVCTGISSLVLSDSKEKLTFKNPAGPITSKIYQALTDIQFGAAKEDYGWIRKL